MSKPSVEPPPKPSDDTSSYSWFRQRLFNEAMNRNWETVKDLYKNEKVLQGIPITRAKDTLLHVAVSSAPEKIVLELLNIVKLKDMAKILNKKNKTGDTPLHLAAAIGLKKVCRKIVKLCPDMVTSARNNLQETPLFSAVRHGNKNAFFELELAIHKNQSLKIDEDCLIKRDTTHCRRDDGNNILHYAIKGEQFDLAYEIIHLYPLLVNYTNSSGETALHTLANKPSVFKSGARFGLYDTIIYHWTITEPLKYNFVNFLEREIKYGKYVQQDILQVQEDENKVMPIYKVCIDLYSLMKHSISCIFNTNACRSKIGTYKAWCTDVENPSSSPKTGKDPISGEEDPSQSPIFVQEDPSSSSSEEDLSQSPISVQEDSSSSLEPVAASSSKPVAASSSEPVAASSSEHVAAPSSEPVAAPSSEPAEAQKEPRRMYPKNHDTMILFFKMIVKLLLVVLGIGLPIPRLQTITEIKQQHRNAKKIMNELVNHSTLWKYEEASGGMEPDLDESSLPFEQIESLPPVEITPNPSEGATERGTESAVLVVTKKGITELIKYPVAIFDQDMVKEKESRNRSDDTAESPVLVAAKKGIAEIVKKILKSYPVAIFDQDKDAKNIVLLAVEHRRVHVYDYLMKFAPLKSVFRKLDKEGNSALHLAAKLSDNCLWSTGAALHIQWEIKWYKYVRRSMRIMGEGRSTTANNAGQMPEEVFIESHHALIKEGITGLTNTCQSCSVVAALFATVAFQSVSTVPGGVDQQFGIPIYSKRPFFHLFTISSLLALCFSVTSVVMFLAILISNFKIWDFERRLPVKLILGMTSLFMAIAFTLVAFCAGDFYVIESNLKFAAYPIYAIMGFPVTYFAIAQYPLYINLIKQTIKRVPKPELVLDYSS